MTALSDEGAEALALLASEWFKMAARLSRLTVEAMPARVERERAQRAYAQTRIEETLATHGLRLILHDGDKYSPEIPAEPVNGEDFGSDDGLVIAYTLEPTVIFNGRVLARGLVVLAKEN